MHPLLTQAFEQIGHDQRGDELERINDLMEWIGVPAAGPQTHALTQDGKYLIETSYVVYHVIRPIVGEAAPREEIAAVEWLNARVVALLPAERREEVAAALNDAFLAGGRRYDIGTIEGYAQIAMSLRDLAG